VNPKAQITRNPATAVFGEVFRSHVKQSHLAHRKHAVQNLESEATSLFQRSVSASCAVLKTYGGSSRKFLAMELFSKKKSVARPG
jgi:hypothetical protein